MLIELVLSPSDPGHSNIEKLSIPSNRPLNAHVFIYLSMSRDQYGDHDGFLLVELWEVDTCLIKCRVCPSG